MGAVPASLISIAYFGGDVKREERRISGISQPYHGVSRVYHQAAEIHAWGRDDIHLAKLVDDIPLLRNG